MIQTFDERRRARQSEVLGQRLANLMMVFLVEVNPPDDIRLAIGDAMRNVERERPEWFDRKSRALLHCDEETKR